LSVFPVDYGEGGRDGREADPNMQCCRGRATMVHAASNFCLARSMSRTGSDISSPFSTMDTGKGSVQIKLANTNSSCSPEV
jgi:hypothetical protein